MKRLFIIRTPLQLFNAFEVKQRFLQEYMQNELLIVYSSEKDLTIMKAMLNYLTGWDRIIFQKFSGINKKIYAFQLKNKFKKGQYSDVYTSMIYHIPLHLMNELDARNNWLLDDGNETRLIVHNLNRGVYYQQDRSKPWLGIKQNPQLLKKLKLFTLYLDLKTNHQVVINDYRYFKQNMSQLQIKQNTYLMIGSNLIGTYLSSEDNYLKILTLFAEKMKDKSLFYAPHRYLNEALKNKIQLLGYQLLEYDTILELEQMVKGWRFEEYYSIRSTAIDTLSNLYEVKGTYLCILQHYFISKEKWQECDEIWKTANRVIDLGSM